MNKQTIKNILQGKSVTEKEFMTFITDYLEDNGKECTSEQLQGIVTAINHNMFSIQYAAEQAGLKLGMLITKTLDKQGRVIKVDIKE